MEITTNDRTNTTTVVWTDAEFNLVSRIAQRAPTKFQLMLENWIKVHLSVEMDQLRDMLDRKINVATHDELLTVKQALGL